MSAKSSVLFFATGLYLSTILKRKHRHIVLPSVASFSMVYGGAYYEFDNLVSEGQIKPTSPGFWFIGGGLVSAGIATGNVYRRIFKNKN